MVLVVDALDEVGAGDDLEAVGVGLDKGVGRERVDGAAGVVVVVLELRAVELIVLEALAGAVDVVHVLVEGGGVGLALIIGGFAFYPGTLPGGDDAVENHLLLAADDASILAVGFVHRSHYGVLGGVDGLGCAGVGDGHGPSGHAAGVGGVDANVAFAQTFAVVGVDLVDRLDGLRTDFLLTDEMEAGGRLSTALARLVDDADVGVEEIAIHWCDEHRATVASVGYGTAAARIVDLLEHAGDVHDLAVRAFDAEITSGDIGDLPSGREADAGAAISGGSLTEGLGYGSRAGGCRLGGGILHGFFAPCLVEGVQHDGLGFGEVRCIVIEHGGHGLRAVARDGDDDHAGERLGRAALHFCIEVEEDGDGGTVFCLEKLSNLRAISEVAMHLTQHEAHRRLEGLGAE